MFGALVFSVVLAFETGATDEIAAGKTALAAHDYARAAESFRAAAVSSRQADGEESLNLESLTLLAAASRLLGIPDQAEQALKQAAPLAIKLHGDTSLEIASVLSELSGAQRVLGKQTEALLSLDSAIRIREGHPTEQLAEFANDLLSAALIRIDLEDAKAAIELLNRALSTCEKASPPESPQCLRVLDALADLLRDRSEYSEAEPLYVRALRLREAAFGPESPDLISTLDSLAYVYFGLQRYADAEPVYKRLLDLWETSAGPEHPMVALTLDKMAEFFAAQERNAEAGEFAARATAMRAKSLVESLNRAGRIQLAQSKLEEAEDTYRRAVLIADEGKAPDEVIEPVLRAHAGVLRKLDRGEEAEALEQRIRAIVTKKGSERKNP
jgi:tetratricopeptide (TPR) repeat protein